MTSAPVRHDALVLAGGRASRLGTPKPGLVIAGRPLLDHVLAATSSANRIVVVGPPELARPDLDVVREEPAFGGPVAGLDAGLRRLARRVHRDDAAAGIPANGPAAEWVLILACDIPRAAEAIPLLLTAATSTGPEVDAVHLTRNHRDQWLVGLYRRTPLAAAVDTLRDADESVHGLSIRAVIRQLTCLPVQDPVGLSEDIDTWDDMKRLAPGESRPVTEEDQ